MTETPKDLSLEELIKLGERIDSWSKINLSKRDDELTYEEGYRGDVTHGIVMEICKVIYPSILKTAYKISAFKEFSEGRAILGSAGQGEETLKNFYDKVSQTTEKRIKQRLDTERYFAIRQVRDLIK